MPYLVPADFRSGTLIEATQGLALSASEIDDPTLTQAIATQSGRIDHLCDDHFDKLDALTFIMSGDQTRFLDVPKRIRAITSVSLLLADGTFSLQPATAYTVTKSVGGTTWDTVDLVHGVDRIDVAYGKTVSGAGGGGYVWPSTPGGVQLVGNFGWPECPPRIKRAVALAVWDQAKGMQDILRRAVNYSTADLNVTLAGGSGTGIPELDQILKEFHRGPTFSVR